ncbi:MAG: hypothetical protein ACRETO_12145, partial [Gammaproteobacteria bacterium]
GPQGPAGEQATVTLQNGKADIEMSSGLASGSYAIAVAYPGDADIVTSYDDDGNSATPPVLGNSVPVTVLPGDPVALQMAAVSRTNLPLGDPDRLEAGETVTVKLSVVDAYGNTVSTVKDANGVRQDATFDATIALSGHATSGGDTGSVVLHLNQGTVNFPVTDSNVETVTLVLGGITPQPAGLDTNATLSLSFLKPRPAISSANFGYQLDDINVPMLFRYTEPVQKSIEGLAVAVSLNGTPVSATETVESDTVRFTEASGFPLNTCYQYDTNSSVLVGVAANDPVLKQNGTVCSPQVDIPAQTSSYALEGSTKTLNIDFGTGVDPSAITQGQAFINEIEQPFDWTARQIKLPITTGTAAKDGDPVVLRLAGVLDGKALRIANSINIHVLQAKGDFDGDGLSNAAEYELGLDPTNPDTNGDGISDGMEDSDGDGLSNAAEVALGTNPAVADTDGDGLTDGDEVNKYHTDPLKVDTDGDGVPDGVEVSLGSSPTDANSVPDLSPYVTSLDVTPADVNLDFEPGMPPVQLDVVAHVSVNGDVFVLDVTANKFGVQYSSTDASVARYSSDGAFNVLGGGDADLDVTFGSVSVSSHLSVTQTVQQTVSTAVDPATPVLYAGSDRGHMVINLDSSVPVEVASISLDGSDMDVEDCSAPGIFDQDPAQQDSPFARVTTNQNAPCDDSGTSGNSLPPPSAGLYNASYVGTKRIEIIFPEGVPADTQGNLVVYMNSWDGQPVTATLQLPVQVDPVASLTFAQNQSGNIGLTPGTPFELPVTLDDAGHNSLDVQYLVDGKTLLASNRSDNHLSAAYLLPPNGSGDTTFIVTQPEEVDLAIGSSDKSDTSSLNMEIDQLDDTDQYVNTIKTANFSGHVDGRYTLDPGHYIVYVGRSSDGPVEPESYYVHLHTADGRAALTTESPAYTADFTEQVANLDTGAKLTYTTLQRAYTGVKQSESTGQPYREDTLTSGGQSGSVLWYHFHLDQATHVELFAGDESGGLVPVVYLFKAGDVTAGDELPVNVYTTGQGYTDKDANLQPGDYVVAMGADPLNDADATSGINSAATSGGTVYVEVDNIDDPNNYSPIPINQGKDVGSSGGSGTTGCTDGQLAAGGDLCSVLWYHFHLDQAIHIEMYAESGSAVLSPVEYLFKADDMVPGHQLTLSDYSTGQGFIDKDANLQPGDYVLALGANQLSTADAVTGINQVDNPGGPVDVEIDQLLSGGSDTAVTPDSVTGQDVAALTPGSHDLLIREIEHKADGSVQVQDVRHFNLTVGSPAACQAPTLTVTHPADNGPLYLPDTLGDYLDDRNFYALPLGFEPLTFRANEPLSNVAWLDAPGSLPSSDGLQPYGFTSSDGVTWKLVGDPAYLVMLQNNLTSLTLGLTSNCGEQGSVTVPVNIQPDPAPQATVNGLTDNSLSLHVGEMGLLDLSLSDAGRDITEVTVTADNTFDGNTDSDLGYLSLLSGFSDVFITNNSNSEVMRPDVRGNTDGFDTAVSFDPSSLSVGDHTLYVNVHDMSGHLTTLAPITLHVLPSVALPTLSINPTGLQPPPGQAIPVHYYANALSSLDHLEIQVIAPDGSSTDATISLSSNQTDSGETYAQMPTSAKIGDVLTLKAIAYDASGNASKPAFANVSVGDWGAGTVTVNGYRSFDDTMLYAKVIVPANATLYLGAGNSYIAMDSLDIQSGGTVDVDGVSLKLHSSLVVESGGLLEALPVLLSNQGGTKNPGGYHGGDSTGNWNGTGHPYDDMRDPKYPGASGGARITYSYGSPYYFTGASGGGVLDIEVPNVTIDGTVTANGSVAPGNRSTCAYGYCTYYTYDGGGAGGSISIHAQNIQGTGAIQADGGAATYANQGSGAGGQIAIHYTSYGDGSTPLSSAMALQALSGTAVSGAYYGGAGTVFLKQDSQANGDLIIKAAGHFDAKSNTSLRSIGRHQITGIAPVADSNDEYVIALGDSLPYVPNDSSWESGAKGLYVSLDADNPAAPLYKVVDNDSNSITVQSDQDLSGYLNKTLIGVIRIDNLILDHGVNIASADRLDLTNPIVSGADPHALDGINEKVAVQSLDIGNASLTADQAVYIGDVTAQSLSLDQSS